MYPNELIKDTGLDLYIIFIVIGILATFVTLRYLSGVMKMNYKVFNFVIVTAIFAIVVGWLAAMLFQAFYNFLATGEFRFAGQTFYGGLIGGVIAFVAFYFGVGHFIFKKKEHVADFDKLLTMAMPSIVVAHAFGRIGCLMDGCCYGAITDAWYGIEMLSGGVWAKRVPTQLFEAIFLFLLFAVLVVLIVRKKFRNTPSVYLIAYGVWRFLIEFIRDDNRGSSGIPGLYPSQLTAIILVIIGVVWIFVYEKKLKHVFDGLVEKAAQDSSKENVDGAADEG